MSQPTDKHRQEAREIADRWWHNDIEGEAELPIGSLAKLTTRIAAALSSRDTELREVLEGLMANAACWCGPNVTGGHEAVCLAARGLWERVQVDVKKEESNVAE